MFIFLLDVFSDILYFEVLGCIVLSFVLVLEIIFLSQSLILVIFLKHEQVFVYDFEHS